MSKKRAIFNICIICLVTVLGLVFSFLAFNTNKKSKFVGFANAIYQGLDYNGGIYAEYNAIRPDGLRDADFSEKLDSTYTRVESVLSSKNINNANVYKSKDGRLRIEALNKDDASDVLAAIGAGLLKIRTLQDSASDPLITGEQIIASFVTQLQVSSYSYQWGAYVAFDEESAELLKTTTQNASNSAVTLYFYRGDSENAFFSLNISSPITDNFMFISSSSMSEDYAESLALQIYCGSLPLTVEMVGNNVYTVSAGLGNEAILGTAIAGAALILLIIVLFVIRYREFGLMATISFLLFTGLTLFLLQAMPIFELTLSGMAGVMATILLFAISHIIIFEKIKNEFESGKKLLAAYRSGFKKSYGLILDISIVTFITGILSYFIGVASLKAFGIALVAGSILSCALVFIVTKPLLDSYLVFNKKNNKRVNLKREEGINEIG